MSDRVIGPLLSVPLHALQWCCRMGGWCVHCSCHYKYFSGVAIVDRIRHQVQSHTWACQDRFYARGTSCVRLHSFLQGRRVEWFADVCRRSRAQICMCFLKNLNRVTNCLLEKNIAWHRKEPCCVEGLFRGRDMGSRPNLWESTRISQRRRRPLRLWRTSKCRARGMRECGKSAELIGI